MYTGTICETISKSEHVRVPRSDRYIILYIHIHMHEVLRSMHIINIFFDGCCARGRKNALLSQICWWLIHISVGRTSKHIENKIKSIINNAQFAYFSVFYSSVYFFFFLLFHKIHGGNLSRELIRSLWDLKVREEKNLACNFSIWI